MINVDGKYYISADKYCYTLNRKQYNQAQKADIFVKMTYHRTLKECIDKIIVLRYKEFINSKEVTLKESLDELIKIKNQYHDTLEGIEEELKDNKLNNKLNISDVKYNNIEKNEDIEDNENIEDDQIIDEADLEELDDFDNLDNLDNLENIDNIEN
jgi:hypothetical protein